jgi:hypothetical protein
VLRRQTSLAWSKVVGINVDYVQDSGVFVSILSPPGCQLPVFLLIIASGIYPSVIEATDSLSQSDHQATADPHE